ncbi:MAG: VCBS repeat-containing protein [Myxococcales bacterium]|nr:VCBS repeat-containing protein [Myxococcales bacterium]
MDHRVRAAFRCLAVLLLFVAPPGGCDCGGGGTAPGETCMTSADCTTPGAVCIGGRCVVPDGGGEADVEPPDEGGGADEGAGETCPGRTCGDACCEPGQLCRGGVCCDSSRVCGSDGCCGDDEVCVDGECRLDCGDEPPCGDVCCGDGEVCHAGGCTVPGDPCDDPYDCPADMYCEPTIGRCLPRGGIDETCEYRPPTGVFTPQVEWTWSGSAVEPAHDQVMMQPIVVPLTDDNGDGAIDERDVPDVVFHTFSAATGYQRNGVLRAVHGDGSGSIFDVTDPAYRTRPDSSLAAADIDGDGRVEIVTCSPIDVQGVLAFENDGTFRWHATGGPLCRAAAPAIGDVDGDGQVEIAIGRGLLRGTDGSVIWRDTTHPLATGSGEDAGGDFSTLADMDGDGRLELVAGTTLYDTDGTVLWDAGLPTGYPAVGDLDLDGSPDVVVVQSRGSGVGSTWNDRPHHLQAFRADGTVLWGPVDLNQGWPTPDGPAGGGPPTIADFDGDGRPEVAAAGGYGYVIFEGEDGRPLWFMETIDRSSRCTGSSVFDFEGDGAAEAVYGDEYHLHVYRGADGFELFTTCNTSATHWEYPVIVDVDNDQHAEIVIARNNYNPAFVCDDGSRGPTGIAVIGDLANNWVRTRRIWNQHTYHVTNVEENGTVPRAERRNWTVPGLNNFRQNVQPEGLFAAPDLVVARVVVDERGCADHLGLAAWITNRGAAGAPAGIPVAFYEGDPSAGGVLLGVVPTPTPILPGASVRVALDAPVGEARVGETIRYWVVVDDDGTGAPSGAMHECRDDNNGYGPVEGECPRIG